MKTKFKYIIVCIAGMMLWSCDDFLTEKPATSLFDTHIFANDETARSGLIACYAMVCENAHYGAAFPFFLWVNSVFGTTGLNYFNRGNGAEMKAMAELAYYETDANNSGMESMWSGVYATLVTVNNFINAVDKAPGISSDGKRKLIGEARFLRAWCHFDVVRIWGEAPLKMGPLQTIADGNMPKSSVEAFFTAILGDLEYAEENMPKKSEQALGRPFNYAATTLKAKVYQQMATSQYMFTHNNKPDPYTDKDREGFWEECYKAAKKVYDANVYALIPNYADLWRCKTENTVESIFELQFKEAVSKSWWGYSCIPGQSTYTPLATNSNNSNRMMPSRVMYEWHKERYFDPGTNEVDPRIDETYIVGEFYKNAIAGGNRVLVYPDKAAANLHPCLKKYCDPKFTENTKSNMNLKIYRYADLLLMLAEAANEVGDPDGLKFKVVNEILERARNSVPAGEPKSLQPAAWDPGDPRFSTKELFRDEVFRERLFELPIENHEWFDVRRRGVEEFKKWATLYNEGLEQYKIDADTPTTGDYAGKDLRYFIPLKDRDGVQENGWHRIMFLPIPILEINNNSNMTQEDQNYGYKL